MQYKPLEYFVRKTLQQQKNKQLQVAVGYQVVYLVGEETHLRVLW